jgi:hypothetical protein
MMQDLEYLGETSVILICIGMAAQACKGDNIKVDLYEVGWEAMGWIELAQDRDR